MTIALIPMKCPNCGAALEVSPQLEHFNCGYCGSPVNVVRTGGTVSLVVDALSNIRSGTDRTAAELALVRLKGELSQIDSEIEQSNSYVPHMPVLHVPPPQILGGLGKVTVQFVLAWVVLGFFYDWITVIPYVLAFWLLYFFIWLLVFLVSRLAAIKKYRAEESIFESELARIHEWHQELRVKRQKIEDQIRENYVIVRRPVQ